MAILTNTPRYLNLDNDDRILQPSEMSDALNVRVTSTDDGDSGVVKNIKGNSAVGSNLGYSIGTNKIVGTYEHKGTNRVFFFVRNSTGYNSIYELNQGDSSPTKIIESTNIVLADEPLSIDGMIVNDELHLYFTDGVNEPQKVNVDTDQAVGTYPSSQVESSVIKVAPHAPTVEYKTDSAKKSNELLGKSFQFALQYVYRDGEVSAIGEYSENKVSFNTLNNFVRNPKYDLLYNKIEIGIGGGTLGLGLGTTIPKLRLYFRDVQDNTMYYVGEYTYTELFNKVDFYNDGSYSVVSDAEYNKIQDAVPKTAKAQTISANRLFYGNYTEGFDNPDTSATIALNYGDTILQKEFTATTPLNNFKIRVNTEDVEFITNSSDDLEVFVSTKVENHAQTPNSISLSGLPNQNIDLYNLDGTLFGTATTTLFGCGISDFSIFESATITAPTSRADFNTKLASALDGRTIEVSVNGVFGTSATYNGTTYLIYWSGKATITLDSFVTSNDVDIDLKVTALDLTSSRIKISGSDNQPLKASVSNLSVSNVAISNMTITDTDIYAFVEDEFRTFKSGESHSFGIVFEDQYGRTSGVQEIGSIDVPYISERPSDERGIVHVDITPSASNLDSDFSKFFYVYSGGNSIDDYVQYSVADAYVAASNNVELGNSNTIFLALRTLQGKSQSYCSENGGDIEYNFAEGDKIRIISYQNEDGEVQYPSEYIFNIVGFQTLETSIFKSGHGHTDFKTSGQFLIIEDAEYGDFDYNSVSSYDDNWSSNCVVEIFSPKKEQTTKIYKAIEGKYNVSELGNTHTIKQGNAWYKQRRIKFSSASDQLTRGSLFYVESKQYSDYDNSTKGFLGGKPYSIITNEKEEKRISSITYSDPQFADSSQNNLSSFNNSLANFKDYEMNYGGIYGLVDMSDSITVLQSDKCSLIPVSRQILSTGTGSEFVTQSTDILGLQRHYSGDFGINTDRTAFLKAEQGIYLVDVTRSKLVLLSEKGTKILNSLGVDSWVDSRTKSMLADPQGYFVSIGQDSENNEIVFSLQNLPLSSYDDAIVYSPDIDKFTSFVSYPAPYYGNLGLRFFQVRGDDVYEAEKSSTYSNFFGTQLNAHIECLFNQSTSARKVYQAFSIDGTSAANLSITTDDQSATLAEGAFVKKEGVFFVDAPRAAGSSEYVTLGEVSAESDPEITFTSKVNRLPFKLGGDAYTYANSVYTQLSGCTVDGAIDSKTLSFTNGGAISVGDVIAIKSDSGIDGDSLRGSFAKVKFTFDDTNSIEIFAVSASVANSSLHSIGSTQQ